MRPVLALCLLLQCLAINASQAQQLVKDINPGVLSSLPQQLLPTNGKIYFVAYDGTHGQELWKTDGTNLGTVLIKDIAPGSTDAQIKDLVNLNGTLYFSAVSTLPNHEKRQLWKSDGTEAGTLEMPDGHKDGEVYDVLSLTKVGNALFYIKRSALGGNDYWMLYKVQAGSQETTAIYTFSTFDQTPPRLGQTSGILYIGYQKDLYKVDPQSASQIPVLVKAGIGAYTMVSYQNALYFTSGFLATELWVTQGTEATTKRIFGPDKGSITSLKAAGEYLFFTAGQEGKQLWISKGDAATTRLLQSFAFAPSNITSIFADFTIMGRTPVYFTVSQDGKLYYTLGGTVSTASGSFTGPLQNLVSLQNTLYFTAANGLHRVQGSMDKTASVLASTNPINSLAALNSTLYFSVNRFFGTGTELYQLTPLTSKLF